jgi:hypothetical protein
MHSLRSKKLLLFSSKLYIAKLNWRALYHQAERPKLVRASLAIYILYIPSILFYLLFIYFACISIVSPWHNNQGKIIILIIHLSMLLTILPKQAIH